MTKQKRTKMAAALVAATAVALAAGCSPQQKAAALPINDKVYSVTPDVVKVKAGFVVGEMTELKVMERVEEGSGRVETPARLTGKLALKNVSADQTVRLLDGRITYIDAQGKPIVLEDNRTAPLVKFAGGYGSPERLDPGQTATLPIEAEFPVEALKAKRLKDIRLWLSYIPSAYREDNLNFTVSIAAEMKK
jgi:hypothetical protein